MLRFLEKILSAGDDDDMEIDDDGGRSTTTSIPFTASATTFCTSPPVVKDSYSPSRSLQTIPKGHTHAESILAFNIKRMKGKNKRMPGGASAESLTHLICNEYGWPVEPVRINVERALQKAVREGRVMICENGNKSKYIIKPSKMQECLQKLKERPVRKNMIQELSNDLGPTVQYNRENITTKKRRK